VLLPGDLKFGTNFLCSALGHPLGCTGARQVVTALSELRRQNKRIAVTSMCVGTGMGMAGVFVSEH
jgi:acetyl-CoA acyltransferase 1